ncbi:hypothetical protein ES703_15678 [subsurface metagenome]
MLLDLDDFAFHTFLGLALFKKLFQFFLLRLDFLVASVNERFKGLLNDVVNKNARCVVGTGGFTLTPICHRVILTFLDFLPPLHLLKFPGLLNRHPQFLAVFDCRNLIYLCNLQQILK